MIKICFIVLISMFMLVYPAFSETLAEPPSNFHDHNAGSEENPFLIANLANLRWLSETHDVWGGIDDMGNQRTKYFFRQTADIDATETKEWNDGFKPIGSSTYNYIPLINDYFRGNFNGNDHVIKNLYITSQYVPSPIHFIHTAMFSIVFESFIENINLDNAFIYSYDQEDWNVGALIGESRNTTIKNCSVNAEILVERTDKMVHQAYRIGGLIGLASNSDVINSSFSGNINIPLNKSAPNNISFIGGLVGESSDYSLINECNSSGSIIVGNLDNHSYILSNLGGLIGNASRTHIEHSYSKADIYNYAYAGGSLLGGMIGKMNESTLQNSFFYGSIYTTAWTDGFSAGLVGHAITSSLIRSCYVASTDIFIDMNLVEYMAYGLASTDISSNLSNCFWDIESTGFHILFPDGGYLFEEFGLITEEMKKASTFINNDWDFINIWDIDPNINDGYPFLRENITSSESETGHTIIPLMQSIVHPNPIRDGNVTIRFNLHPLQSSSLLHEEIKGGYETEIRIYNLRGQLVKRSNDFQTKNIHKEFVWDRKDENNRFVPSGVYFFQIKNDLETQTGRFVILK
ncbi:MAG: T9SS type A sorting domain-containing protein [Candidatus Cloacimonetes bacterium]|nr:T9SS type A sorting domain-containing protein [Candidatus Cloacimonadota bacterium]